MSEPFRWTSFDRPVIALVQGASRGIGLGMTRQLLDADPATTVFATCRDPGRAGPLAVLGEGYGERLRPIPLDVCDEATIASAAATVEASAGRLDLLVNCAGLLHDTNGLAPERRLADVERASVLASFEVNALGPLLVAKHFGGLFPRASRAVLASLSARVGSIGDNRLGGWYAYRASKAAQNMVTCNLSIERRRRSRGIICVGLHPGTVDTDLSRPFQGGVPAQRLFGVERAARQLLEVIDGLTAENNGGFFAWDGSAIPW